LALVLNKALCSQEHRVLIGDILNSESHKIFAPIHPIG